MRSGVSVLAERSGLITAQYVVAEGGSGRTHLGYDGMRYRSSWKVTSRV